MLVCTFICAHLLIANQNSTTHNTHTKASLVTSCPDYLDNKIERVAEVYWGDGWFTCVQRIWNNIQKRDESDKHFLLYLDKIY